MRRRGLDFVVDPLDPASGDIESSMGNNALKMLVENTTEPEQMLVFRNSADVHDVGYFLRHGRLVRLLVGACQLVLDDVQSKEKLVLSDKLLVPLDIARMEAVENGSFGGEVLYGTLQNGTLSTGRLCDLVPADVQEKYLGYIDEMIKRAFLLDAEHRQEDHRLCFQVIQVATDGADSAGQSKG